MPRRSPLILAVALVGIPGVFALFPEWLVIHGVARAGIFVAWLVIVYVTAREALRQDAQIDDLLEPALERRANQKQVATPALLELLLEENRAIPRTRFHLYTFDPVKGELIASYPNKRAQSWRVGHGVTGEAWRRRTEVIARGAEVSDATYGLTKDEQERYRDLQVVAGTPVLNDREELIAVLTASSSVDDGYLASPAGRDKHKELAQITGRILVDITNVGAP